MHKVKYILPIIVSCACFAPCFATNKELAEIQNQIKQTEKQNEEIEKKLESSKNDMEQTKQKLVETANQVSDLEEQRAILTKRIAELDKQKDKIQKELDKNYDAVADATSGMLFIASNPNFDSETMHEYILTSVLLTSAADSYDSQIQEATKKIQELEKIRKERASEKEKLDRSAKKYSNEKKELDKLLKTRSKQNEQLKSQQIALKDKLKKLSVQAKNISELSAGVGSSEMSSDAKFSKRKLNSPVRGRLTVRFGEKTAMGFTSDGWRIRTRSEALVLAPADGVVKFAENFHGYGKVIIISHKNGYNTIMANMGQIDVFVGQDVLAGEPIGRTDENRDEMYLTVRRGDKVIDPASLFKEP